MDGLDASKVAANQETGVCVVGAVDAGLRVVVVALDGQATRVRIARAEGGHGGVRRARHDALNLSASTCCARARLTGSVRSFSYTIVRADVSPEAPGVDTALAGIQEDGLAVCGDTRRGRN